MTFECKDLDRALETPELLPDAREHARTCAECRRALWLWTEIATVAAGLREEWESPEHWTRIRKILATEPQRKPVRRLNWRVLSAIAAIVLAVCGAVIYTRRPSQPVASDFLTDQAVQELERNESAYLRSIDKLAHIAEPDLQTPNSALSAAYREKLKLLDSEIVELRASIAHNRFNTRLQTELAMLYREKQDTLKEIVHRERKN